MKTSIIVIFESSNLNSLGIKFSATIDRSFLSIYIYFYKIPEQFNVKRDANSS